MSTHNIGFYEEISKIIIKYPQIRTLFLLLIFENLLVTSNIRLKTISAFSINPSVILSNCSLKNILAAS